MVPGYGVPMPTCLWGHRSLTPFSYEVFSGIVEGVHLACGAEPLPNDGIQPTALRAAADAERSAAKRGLNERRNP
jgi:hypothetical protein